MNERGTIVKVRLDPTEDREQAGVRPALVVSSTFFNERSDLITVIPITSQKVDRVYPFEVLIDEEGSGLDRASKAMVNHLRAIDKKRVVGTFGIVGEETLRKLDRAIELFLGITKI